PRGGKLPDFVGYGELHPLVALVFSQHDHCRAVRRALPFNSYQGRSAGKTMIVGDRESETHRHHRRVDRWLSDATFPEHVLRTSSQRLVGLFCRKVAPHLDGHSMPCESCIVYLCTLLAVAGVEARRNSLD